MKLFGVFAPILILFCKQLSPVRALCPAPFNIEAGKCVFVNTTKSLNWCDANRQCASIGGELINLYSSLKLLSSMPSLNCTNCRMWVGVTDLADERGTNRSDWQLINDNGILPLNDSLWYFGMPSSNGNQDCLATHATSPSFIDMDCSVLRGFVCEFVAAVDLKNPNTWNQSPFKRTDFNARTSYCYTDVLLTDSVFECVAAAVSSGNSRHVLYNSKLRTCRLLQFTDAQVEEEIETSVDWVKFSVF